MDKDGDGTDDQTDILTNALVYVKKRPIYKSRYYQTGYPDDRYGVCTDVVGYALKKSGYDLRELVDEDIRKNPKDYDIDEPDKNIDFRRVKNLKIYFEHTAISLTTDVNDIEQWQGGDIVVFKNHIGVISDRRNVEGVQCFFGAFFNMSFYDKSFNNKDCSSGLAFSAITSRTFCIRMSRSALICAQASISSSRYFALSAGISFL